MNKYAYNRIDSVRFRNNNLLNIIIINEPATKKLYKHKNLLN